jgi:uncharacterized membrane protein YfcA
MSLTLITSILFIIGILGGALVSLAGVGCTLLFLPTLLFWFPHFLPTTLATKMAIATTLAATTIAAIFTTYLHIKNKNINFKLSRVIIILYLITATTGPYLVHYLRVSMYEFIIGIVLIFVALRLITKKIKHNYNPTKANPLLFTFAILVAGFANSICGIGAGNVAIPYLSRHYPYKTAIGTSIFCALFTCLISAVSYIIYGWDLPDLPRFAAGYVYLPAFIALSIGVIVGTPLGYLLSKKIHISKINYILATVVAAAGIFAIVKSLP